MSHFQTIRISVQVLQCLGNTVFTAANAGNYYISYSINITAALLVSSRITINGAPLAGTINSPALATTSFSATIITTLAAGVQLVCNYLVC